MVPVSRIEFRRIKGRGNRQQQDDYETVLGVFQFFSTHRERKYGQDTDLPQRSTQIRWGGQDGRREPDSGLGHTQDYRTRWTDDDRVDPDSFIQRTEQPAGRKRRAGGRLAADLKRRRYTETVGGISHGSVPCLRSTGRIVRRLVVTFRRATQIDLRR